MWMKRWCIMIALAVFGWGTLCSCGKSDAVEDTAEDSAEETDQSDSITEERDQTCHQISDQPTWTSGVVCGGS